MSDTPLTSIVELLGAGRVFFNIDRKLATRDPEPRLVQFNYVNWKGEPHHYVVQPESVEYAELPESTARVPGERAWMLHGELMRRDHDTRPTRSRRRSFRVADLEDLEVMR